MWSRCVNSFLLGWLAIVPAMAATISFSGTGKVAPTGPPDGSGVLPFAVIQPTTSYDLGDGKVWQLTAPFFFNPGTMMGFGTFLFSNGADFLAGSLITDGSQTPGVFSLTYNVTGAGGRFSGMAGTGSAAVLFLGDPNQPPTPYREDGSFTLAAVPEPFTLFLVGLALCVVPLIRHFGKVSLIRRRSC